MLGTDLKPAARFKTVQTHLKPSGRFRSRPDGLRAVQTASKPSVRTNVVTKPSSKRAAKPPLPVENNAVRDLSHSDPLQCYKRRRRYNYDASELDFPLLPAVNRCLEELFPTARKQSRLAEPYARRSALVIGLRPLCDLQRGNE